MPEVKVTRLPHSEGLPLPFYATDGSAACDLIAALDDDRELFPGETAMIPTGLVVAVPPGFELQVRSRSGFASKGIFVINSPGTVDSDYRGEVKVLLHNSTDKVFTVSRGMRIAQALLAEVIRIDWAEVDALDETARGTGGFGSTGAGA